MLDKLIKITTLLGTFLVFNGIVYLSIYYHHFGIRIFSYLEFTEVITAFLDSLKTILTFFGIYVLHGFISSYFYYKKKQEQEHRLKFFKSLHQKLSFDMEKEILNTLNKTGSKIAFLEKDDTAQQTREIPNLRPASKPLVPISKKREKEWGKKMIIQLSICVFFLACIWFDFFTINEWHIYFGLFVTANVIQYFFQKAKSFTIALFGKSIQPFFYVVIILIFPFMLYTIAFASYDAYKKELEAGEVIIMQQDGTAYPLNKSSKLIGKTNKFLFLYNFKTKTPVSVSLEGVKSIEYR